VCALSSRSDSGKEHLDQEAPTGKFLDRILQGYQCSQLLYVAAKIGLADAMGDGTREVTELAESLGLDARMLGRVLRGLTFCGFVRQVGDSRFCLTPFGERFRSGVPDSLRERAIFMGEIHYPAWAGLRESLQSGQTAFETTFGTDLFAHLERDVANNRRFQQMMAEDTQTVAEHICRSYDFQAAWKIVDIGGGRGTLLAAVLAMFPHLSGILFDGPSILPAADFFQEHPDLAGRCQLMPGDFLRAVPAGGDLYILKSVLQDGNDERAARILDRCRQAMESGQKLLVIERIVPEGGEDSARWIDTDLHLLVLLGGRERTLAEHRQLLTASGFGAIRLIPTTSPVGIIEAVAG
jgi:hypothetical protein